ncbi:MAG: haloacid dehalogenase-like hydrolase [Planctomycetaceae bacterium]|nr:haloacid dehalogenase-like hydrolase [Planctomycetaceae bacterium]
MSLVTDNNTNRHHQSLAIFDLDGTLTIRDSFVAYLWTFGRRQKRYLALTEMPVRIAAYLARLQRDYEVKERLLTSFFRGVPQAIIQQHTVWFCQNWLPRNLHPIGLRHLQEHQQSNHRILLVSASPDLYVREVAETLGIKEVLCTEVEFDRESCTGRLQGKNCKGVEKVTRVARYLESESAPPSSFAYGDSSHDYPLLRWVDRGILVSRNSSQLLASPLPDKHLTSKT